MDKGYINIDNSNLKIKSESVKLNEMENFKTEATVFKQKTPIFHFFLLIGSAALLLIAFFIYLIVTHSIVPVKILLRDKSFPHANYDNRQYELIELKNGIQVLLVYDPNAPSCALGLTLPIGCNSDENIHGLGQLVQKEILQFEDYNVLIPGTDYKKGEEEIWTHYCNNLDANRLLTQGGDFEDNSTSFYFTLDNSGLEEAMSCYGYMLKHPEKISNLNNTRDKLIFENAKNTGVHFIETSIKRAILFNDTEYNPYGDNITLSELKEENIIDYANRILYGKNMKMVIYSNQRLYAMRQNAIKFFQGIKEDNSTNINKNIFNDPVTLDTGKIFMFNNNSNNALHIGFFFKKDEIKDLEFYLKYIKYQLKSQKKTSLSAYLRENATATSYDIEIKTHFPSTIELDIEIRLDISNYTSLTNAISAVFNYINLLKKEIKTHEKIYNEYKKILSLNYKFQSFPSNFGQYVLGLSKNFLKVNEDYSNILYGDNFIPEYNEEILLAVLNKLNYTNSLFALGRNYNRDIIGVLVDGNEFNKTKKLKEYVYHSGNIISNEMEKLINSFNETLDIRSTNSFVTKLSETQNKEKGAGESTNLTTECVINTRHSKLYHKVRKYFFNF